MIDDDFMKVELGDMYMTLINEWYTVGWNGGC